MIVIWILPEAKPNQSRAGQKKTAGIGFGEEGETLGGGSGRSGGGVAEGLGEEKLARTESDHEEPQNDGNEKRKERERMRKKERKKVEAKEKKKKGRRRGREEERERKRTSGGGVEELSQRRWIDPERSTAYSQTLQRTHSINTDAADGRISPGNPFLCPLAIAGVVRHR